MSLFIATGSNIDDRKSNLDKAKIHLSKKLVFIAESKIYESPAVDYLNQPDFFNQVLEFKIPDNSPAEIMDFLLETELQMGRNRLIPKGPRIIDLDMIFWGDLKIQSEKLILPHPRLFERSFVILPLSELPGFKTLQKKHSFNFTFDNSANPIS
jgi:2-amino-4-hydroxy-6-hydroxymethyldihydropteridine diphosphokinase